MPRGKQLLAVIALLRPVNLLLIAAMQLAVQHFAIVQRSTGWFLTSGQTALVIVLTVSVAAAGYVINDIHDIQVDSINKPGKNKLEDVLSVRTGWLIYWILTVMGAVACLLLIPVYSYTIPIIFTLCTLGLWWYSAYLKRLPLIGNLAVSLFCGLVVMILWIPQHDRIESFVRPSSGSLVWAYTVFAFLITMAREVVKDLEDLAGDLASGARTLPVAWGVRAAHKVCIVLCILLIGAIVTWGVQQQSGVHLISAIYMGFCLALPLAIAAILLARPASIRDYKKVSLIFKLVIALGVLYLIIL